ncbi:hypothetical protein FXO38_23329 [Capsicum annuum]|nr:hypothetical protein FXO38_23329 [Capsicum annuum]
MNQSQKPNEESLPIFPNMTKVVHTRVRMLRIAKVKVKEKVKKKMKVIARTMRIGEIAETERRIPYPCQFVREISALIRLNCSAYPRESKMNKVLQNGESFHFKIWIYEAFPHLGRYADKSLDSPLPIPHLLQWHTFKCDNIMEGDPFKYKGNSTKIVYPYLTPSIREMEQRYMKTFKPYMDKVKDTSIDVLKAQLKGVTVLTSSAKVVDEHKDLGGHHYVPSPPRACYHAGLSGLETSPDASNDDDLCERVALLEKILLDVTYFFRDERLQRSEKNKKKQEEKEKKEEEIEEENVVDEEKEEKEKDIDEEMIAEAEEENEEKTKEDSENKSEEEEDKNEKAVEEESMVEQEGVIVENIEEEKKSVEEEEKKNENKEVEEEEKKQKEKEVDVMGIVAELNQENKLFCEFGTNNFLNDFF